MKLSINRKSGVPLYKQIVDQVTALIRRGVLKNGDRLPAERALAQKYRLSLGTVKTAYSSLALSCLIEPIQGKGTFVNNSGLPAGPAGRLKRAAEIITAYLDRITGLPMPLEEAEALMLAALKTRHNRTAEVRIAVVTCCREFLSTTVATIETIPGAAVTGLLTGELEAARDSLINGFDLIVTSLGHADELKAAAPVLEDKIIRVSYSFDEASLARIASIGEGTRIGIFTHSRNCAETVRGHLEELDPALASARMAPADETPRLRKVLTGLEVLLVPPSYEEFASAGQLADIAGFNKFFGKTMTVDFRIDEGSMLYIGRETARVSMQNTGLSR